MKLKQKRFVESRLFNFDSSLFFAAAVSFLTVWQCDHDLQAQDAKSEFKSVTATSSQTVASADPKEKNSVIDVNFDDLKFEMEKGSKFSEEMLTAKILELDGKVIRIRGFIRPSYTQSGLTKFIFVRDNQACCFGPGAALYDCILVQLAEGIQTDYTLRPITVKGTFYFKQYKGPDGEVWAIYRMKETSVE